MCDPDDFETARKTAHHELDRVFDSLINSLEEGKGGSNKVNITAELKKTSQRKAVSNDQAYQLVFETDNPQIMDLGKLPSDTLFSLEIGIEKND